MSILRLTHGEKRLLLSLHDLWQHERLHMASGVPVAKLSLATNDRFKDKNDAWQDRTESHSIVARQRLAEIVGEYVRKGSKVYIEGKLQTSAWVDKQSGERKYRTEIVARDIVLLGSRDDGQEVRPETLGEESDAEPATAGVADSDIRF